MKTPDQKTDERIEAAKKLSKSGSRKDLKAYLRLRKNTLKKTFDNLQ